MREYLILGDSTCDLNKEIREQYDIDYVQMNYVLEGKEYPASLDWEEMGVHEFYNAMREGKRITTTQVPAETFLAKFNECAEKGLDVLYVGCSSALSGSVNTANVVAKEVMEAHPEMKISCVDARNSSFGQGIQLMWASDQKKAGKTIEEVTAFLEKHRNCVNQCGTVADLSYLKRAGRVTASSAFFGNLIGIKPILISDANGQNFAIKKAKGASNAKMEIVAYLNEVGKNLEKQTVYISHADDEKSVQTLAAMVKEGTGCKDVFTDYIGPIVGASVGPGTVIAYCVGKEETRVGEA
ncbi:MAG: DegV family protein [Lachnospiraceae bacterium]|nr:DegV family protein [Lachnospiraceae bacterium]